jgi:hypothetical protein
MAAATHNDHVNSHAPKRLNITELEVQLAGLSHIERVEYLGRLLQDMQPKAVNRPPPAAETPPVPTASNGAGRDQASGRFTAGNKFARGNPFACRQYALRSALLAAVNEDTLTAIAGKLADLALAGDVPDAALLFSYVLGRPARMVDLLDLEARQFPHAGGDEHGNDDS